MEISTEPITFCTTCSYWRHFEADRRRLLSWKRNVEAGLNAEDDLICALSCIEPRILFFSFVFLPTFPLRRVAGVAALSGLEIPMTNNYLTYFCWLNTKTGPRKVGDVITLPGPWSTSWPLFRGYSQQDLSRQSFPEHSGQMVEPT